MVGVVEDCCTGGNDVSIAREDLRSIVDSRARLKAYLLDSSGRNARMYRFEVWAARSVLRLLMMWWCNEVGNKANKSRETRGAVAGLLLFGLQRLSGSTI